MRSVAVVIVLAGLLAVLAAACGGDGGEAVTEGTQPPQTNTDTAETETATAPTDTETTQTDDSGGGGISGEQVFASAGCGSCHTLDEAGSTGTVGPVLDGRDVSVSEVREQVRNGGGAMPAFEDRLSDEQIRAVAEFVAAASR